MNVLPLAVLFLIGTLLGSAPVLADERRSEMEPKVEAFSQLPGYLRLIAERSAREARFALRGGAGLRSEAANAQTKELKPAPEPMTDRERAELMEALRRKAGTLLQP